MRFFINLILSFVIICQFCIFVNQANAAAKHKGLSEEELKVVEENVDELTKKIYAYSLFTPEDNAKLVDIRTKLNSTMGGNLKNPVYVRLFYDAAYICKEREYLREAVQYFKVVVTQFPGTTYSNIAIKELKDMGVEIDDFGEEH